MAELSQKCVRWTMLIFNLLFFIIGLTLIIAGGVAQSHYNAYSNVAGGGVTAPVVLIIVGVFIAIVAFLGCCGAVRENYNMLVGFAVVVGLIFITQLSAGIAGYVQRGKVSQAVNENFPRWMNEFTSNNASRDAVDVLQRGVHCCGGKNYNDWFAILKNETLSNGTVVAADFVAPSCCINDADCSWEDRKRETVVSHCPLNGPLPSCKIHTQPCVPTIQGLVERGITGVAGAAIGLAFIELIGIGFAVYLARRIRSGYVYA